MCLQKDLDETTESEGTAGLAAGGATPAVIMLLLARGFGRDSCLGSGITRRGARWLVDVLEIKAGLHMEPVPHALWTILGLRGGLPATLHGL